MTSPFSAEIGKKKVRVRPLQETEWTSPSMVTVAECVPVLGKKSKVTLTSLQWFLMATVWASDAVAAPGPRPPVIINTAAIFVFRLMSPPFQVADKQTVSETSSVVEEVGHSYHVSWGGRPSQNAFLSDYRAAWPSEIRREPPPAMGGIRGVR